MKIAFFVDQHPHSLGGVQTSVLLQRKYLQRLGHEVIIFAPKARKSLPDEGIVVLPSYFLTPDREYSTIGNVIKAGKKCLAVAERERFDVVHIQGDFAAATLGQYVAREFSLPVVYTAHTNLEVMGNKVIGKSFKTVVINFFAQQHAGFLGLGLAPLVRDAWEYMAFIHKTVKYAVTPSRHFTAELKERKVTPAPLSILNGVDDDLIDGFEVQGPPVPPPVRFIWSGRMLPEKRILQTITAFARARANAHLDIYGSGPLKPLAKRQVQALGISHKVTFHGKVTHDEMVRAFSSAHALLQTSVGFETQGLTVFEALAVGTPSVVSDMKIASELPDTTFWIEETGTIKGLIQAIRTATEDVLNGRAHRPSVRQTDFLRQSVSTAAMVALYEKAIAEHHPA